jgi:FeS assembly SUF system protein
MSEINGAAADGGMEPAGGVEPTMRDKVEAALRTVFDPEVPVNIYDMGLVYEVKIGDEGKIKITMTLTAPACPASDDIVRDINERVGEIEGVTDVHVNLTFDPPWSKEMMTEEAKLELGLL